MFGQRQIGIISMLDFAGKDGCTKRRPDIHTRVVAYLKWIKANAKGAVPQLGRIADDDADNEPSSANVVATFGLTTTIILAFVNFL